MSAGRLATMLQQLEPAFLTTTTNRRSSAIFSGSSEFRMERKARRKQELVEQISELSATADDKEEMLRMDIDEVEVKLEGVLAAKRRTIQESKYMRDTLTHKKDMLLSSIQKLQQQYDDLESLQQSIETGLDSEQLEKLNAFKIALRPLEDAGHSIYIEKERLVRYNEQFNERLTPLQESLMMTKEDMRAHIMVAEAAYGSRKNFETQLSVFKEKHEEELSDFLEELETREMLKSIRFRKAEQIEKVKKVEKKIVENEKELTRLREMLNRTCRTMTSPPSSPDITIEEIHRHEDYLEDQCQSLDIPELSAFIVSVNLESGYNIPAVILQEQLNVLDNRQAKIDEDWRDEVAALEHELSALNSRLDIDEKALLTQRGNSADSFLERTVKDERGKVAALEAEMHQLLSRQQCESAAIQGWKAKIREDLAALPAISPLPAADRLIQSAFLEAVSTASADLSLKDSITASMLLYTQALQEVADKAAARDNRRKKRSTDMEDFASQLQSAEFQKASLQVEKSSLTKELTKFITTEKTVSKRFEQMKMKAESSQKRAHEDLLSSELSSRSGEMSQIFKTMGNKAVQRLADKTKQDIARTVTSRQRDRRAKLEEKYQEYQDWDKVAQRHNHVIEDQLQPQYTAILTNINGFRGEANKLREQLKAVQEAEDDLQTKMETMIELKKKELRVSMNHAAKMQQAHVRTRKLEAVKATLQSKLQRMDELTKEIESQESLSQSNLSQIILDESQLKFKLSQLQTQMQEVGGDRQHLRSLEKKLQTLEKDQRPESITDSQVARRTAMGLNEEPSTVARTMTRAKSLPSLVEFSGWDKTQISGHGKRLEDSMPSNDMLKSTKAEDAGFDDSLRPAFLIRWTECSKAENEFFHTVMPLLEGVQMYKKLAVKTAIKPMDFDPLDGPGPEMCGYGLRDLRLGKSLTKIEVRQPGRPGVDLSILVSQLLDPILPQITLVMVAGQKKLSPSDSVDEDIRKKYREMKDGGVVNYSSSIVLQMTRAAKWFPVVMQMEKGGRVELVAKAGDGFRAWVDGIRALVRMKKKLHKLKYKVE